MRQNKSRLNHVPIINLKAANAGYVSGEVEFDADEG